jgi:mono/diheme cytochrome c family protein
MSSVGMDLMTGATGSPISPTRVQTIMSGEDAPSLLKLEISGAHMALVIQSGIKDEMPSFAKKYNEQDTSAIVAYLKTLH